MPAAHHETQPAKTIAAARWRAVCARDARADGRFVFAVKTTGVYCRPSCPARRPLARNVAFYDSPHAAAVAGYRPCKRCQPLAPGRQARTAAAVAQACRAIEAAEEPPSLAVLAKAAGFSPYHFHRLFKEATGLTPKRYAAAHRAGRLRAALKGAARVTDAIFDAGFNATSRFYERAPGMLGMSAAAFRAGGAGATIRFALGTCSLGHILVAATDKGLCAILLGDDPAALLRDLQDRFKNATLIGDDKDFAATVARVVGLVEAPGKGCDLPLDIRGTVFQQRVWDALRKIPPGRTVSYSALAATLGVPKAVRAVASACAANPLAIAIPCHRVVRTDGSLSGYRWGLARKAALLQRESKRAS